MEGEFGDGLVAAGAQDDADALAVVAEAQLLVDGVEVQIHLGHEPRLEFADLEVDDHFERRVARVPWYRFETAYGAATTVPDQLIALVGPCEKRALNAASELDGMLCHQHVRADSAALPALPFLIEALDRVSESVAVEMLELIRGLAACVRWLSIERPSTFAATEWIAELDAELIDHTPTWERMRKHPSREVAEYADRILEALSAEEPPELGTD